MHRPRGAFSPISGLSRMESEAVREDRLLGGRLILRQPRHGYRAGADALLLAAAAPAAARALDAGCGAGAALLAAAWRLPETRWNGVERDPAMVRLARGNVSANGMTDRIEIEEGDVLRQTGGSFDLVQCNPPFAEEGEETAPHQDRVGAYVTEAPLDVWIAALANRLRGGGWLTMIHRADRLDRLLRALDGRLGAVTVLPVRPRPSAPARRVLVKARKGSRAPLTLLRGLDLHEGEGFTPEADAIFRGEAAIEW